MIAPLNKLLLNLSEDGKIGAKMLEFPILSITAATRACPKTACR